VRCALIAVVLLLLIVAVSVATADSYVSVWQDQAQAMQATPSWFGNIGMIVTPTAATPSPAAGTVEYHRIQRSPNAINVWGVNVGVANGLEVGGARIDSESGGSNNVGNVKLAIPAAKWLNNSQVPMMAIGSFDVTDSINRALYFVMSKGFQTNGPGSTVVNLHLGLAQNKTHSGALHGVFGGAEFQVFSQGLVQAEYDGDKFNADFRLGLSNHFSLDVGDLGGDIGYGATYKSTFK
jgi:hypothetical protein